MKFSHRAALFAAICSVSNIWPSVASADQPQTLEPTSVQFVVGVQETHVAEPYMGWSVLVTSPDGTPVLQPGQVTFTVADGSTILGTFSSPVNQPSPSGWTNTNPMPNGTVCVFGLSPAPGSPPSQFMELGPCIGSETALSVPVDDRTDLTVRATYSGGPGWAPACSSGINPVTSYENATYVEALNVPCPGQSTPPPVTRLGPCGHCATVTSITSSTSQVPWFTGGYDQPYVQTLTAMVDGPDGSFPALSNGQVNFTLSDTGPLATVTSGPHEWDYPALAAGANTATCPFVITEIGIGGGGDGFDVTSPCGASGTLHFLSYDFPNFITVTAQYAGDEHWQPSLSTTLGLLESSTPTPVLSYSCTVTNGVSLVWLSWSDGPGNLSYEGETQGTVQASSPYPVQDATAWTFFVTVNGQQSNTVKVAC